MSEAPLSDRNAGASAIARLDPALGAAVFVTALVIYMITLAPSVSFWDSGEFIACSYTLGIPHPPGTPLYILLGRVFSLFPFATVAVRINMLSAIPAALSALFLYLTLERIGRRWFLKEGGAASEIIRRCGAIAGALFAAFGSTFWTNAIEAEVYALSNVVIAFCLYLLVRWRDSSERSHDHRLLLLIAYILSLSIGIHLGTYLALPAFALFVFAVNRNVFVQPRLLLLGVFFTLLGVTVHAYLPIRSTLNPNIDEANPETKSEMVDFLLRKQYKPNSPFDREASWDFQFYMYWKYFREQYGLPLALLGVIGASAHWFRGRKTFPPYAMLFLITSLFLIFYMNFTDSEVRERDYFFAPSFFFWGGWMGLGGAVLAERLRAIAGNRAGMAAAALVLLSPAITVAHHFESHDRRGNFIARNYARNTLESLERDALLFTNGDNDTFPLWYVQEVEGVRLDVRIVNMALLNTPWYVWQLKHLEPKVPIALSDEEIAGLQHFRARDGSFVYIKDVAAANILNANHFRRPVYFAVTVSDLLGLDERNVLSLEGLVFKVYPEEVDPVNMGKTEENLWQNYSYEGILDSEGRLAQGALRTMHVRSMVANYSTAYSRLAIQQRNAEQYDDAIRNLEMAGAIVPDYKAYQALMGPLYVEAGKLDEANAFFEAKIETGRDSLESFIGLAYIHQHEGKIDEAIGYYEAAIAARPDDGQAYKRQFRMLLDSGRPVEARELLSRWTARRPDDRDAIRQLAELDREIAERDGDTQPEGD